MRPGLILLAVGILSATVSHERLTVRFPLMASPASNTQFYESNDGTDIPSRFNFRQPRGMRYFWVPIPVFLGAILLLWITGANTVFVGPPFLFPFLNFTFRTAIAVFIAYLAACGFSRNGSLPALGLGCGMLFLGSASVVSALTINDGEINLGLTVYNTALWFSGACHLFAAITALSPGGWTIRRARLVVSSAYALILLLVGLFAFAAFEGMTPVFYIPGDGAATIRQFVLFSAAGMFTLASLLVAARTRRREWVFGRWYAMALALIATGIVAFMAPSEVGSPIGWIGRSAQYLGGLYMLVAVLLAGRQSGEWDTVLQDALEHSEERLRALTEATFEGIVISENGVIIDTNEQFAQILGYKRQELPGRPLASIVSGKFASLVKDRIESGAEGFIEVPLIRKDGTRILIEAHGRTLTRRGRKMRFTAIRDLTERKKQEQALRDANKRVVETLENISDGFVSLDREWNYTYVNRAAAAALETTPEELIGKNCRERWPLTENLAGGKAILRCMAEGHSDHFEGYFAPLDRWFDCHCYPSPDGVSLFFSDTTERKRAEEAYREVKEANERNLTRLDAIVNQMIEGLVVFDPEGNLMEMNAAALEMHGISKVNSIRKHLSELPADFELFDLEGNLLPPERWPIGRVLQGETFSACEVRVRLVATGRFWIGSYGGAPVYDEQGQMQSAIVTLRDVTDERMAEQALRESEQRFRTVVENSRDGIHQFDLVQDRFVFVSPSIEELFGFTGNEVREMSADDFLERVHIKDRPTFLHYLSRVIAGEACRQPAEYRWRVKSGEFRWFSDSRGILRDKDGRGAALIGVTRDISARKEEEQAREKLREELEVRVAERTVELKHRADQLARLTSELTLTEQRERGRLAQVLHDHLQQLLVGAKYGLTLLGRKLPEKEKVSLGHVEQLLNESIEASRSLTVELSPPILREGGLAAALRWLGRWAEQKFGLIVRVSIDEDVVAEREDVRFLIFQAVRELLMNVSKYARVSEAFLELTRDGEDQLRVTVEDHGLGFDPGRIENGAEELAGGFGLFSIRERLDLLGGDLQIKTAVGQGTRITLIAPVREKVGLSKANDRTHPRPPLEALGGRKPIVFPKTSGSRISLLLVDDHAVMRQGLSSLLSVEKDLAIVGEASDGREAVEMARALRPDVILMDFSMPRLDGVEATRMIHDEQPEIRIIGLSMYEEDDRAEEMRKAGASGYVTKSGKSEVLLGTIRQAAAQARLVAD